MPRPDVSEERKEQILDAAAIVFSQQGFASARMDDIVKQSGLSKGALYWYFKSKDEIILALMHRFFDQDIEEMEDLLQSDKPVREILLKYMEHLMDAYQEMQPLMPLMYDYYSSATRDEDKRQFFKDYFEQYQALLKTLIERGIQSGEFKAIDVDAFALTFVAQIEGTLLLSTIEIDMPDLPKQVFASVMFLLDGVKAG